VLIGHLYGFFGEMSRSSTFFSDWVIFVVVVQLYKLFIYFGNLALVGHIICKYFLPVRRFFFFFILLVVSFAVQKLMHLIRLHLFILAFISIASGE